MTETVTVRDRRTLPFFMVRLRALNDIRAVVSGPRRARALGMYALLCQLANEQRSVGEHQRLTATYKELTGRGGLSPNSLKGILGALEDAGAARYELRVDRLRGSLPSLIHLPVQDGAWIAVTVDMAEALAREPDVRLLSALGLLVVLLEFCDDQRDLHGGQIAETTRADIARRLGCGTDTLDGWVKALERANVLTVTRRRGPGGANLPNLWEISETNDQAATHGEQHAGQDRPGDNAGGDDEKRPHGTVEIPGVVADSTLAAAEKYPPGRSVMPGAGADTARADDETPPGRDSTIAATDDRPLNAGGRDRPEPLSSANSFPPTPNPDAQTGEREETADREIGLCRALLTVLKLTRGAGPARRYTDDQDGWHQAARDILADHPADKVLEAIAYLEFDQIIGTKVRSMPDLARHIEDLRHRAHAARGHARGGEETGGPGAPAWAAAFGDIKQAIRRHGAGEGAAARNELAAKHAAYRRFIDSVGWSSLCHDSASRCEYEWKQAWKQACAAADPATEEAA